MPFTTILSPAIHLLKEIYKRCEQMTDQKERTRRLICNCAKLLATLDHVQKVGLSQMELQAKADELTHVLLTVNTRLKKWSCYNRFEYFLYAPKLGSDIELCERDIQDAIHIFQINAAISALLFQLEEAKLNEYRYNEMDGKLAELMQQKANSSSQQQGYTPLTSQEYQRRVPESQPQPWVSADPDFHSQLARSPREVTIAVMGPTGSGKTSFINRASGCNFAVGHGLRSSTSVVETAAPFKLGGILVKLVDTPGFDDTNMSDADVLALISAFLVKEYEARKTLIGLIYVHRISDVRIGGAVERSFRIFQSICGESIFRNVVLVTTGWSEAGFVTQSQREAELRSSLHSFQPAIAMGAKLRRHQSDTTASAHMILREMLQNNTEALRIQVEMVDENKDISQTDAARELGKQFEQAKKRHQDQMAMLKDEIWDAIMRGDEETTREIEEECRQKVEEMAKRQKNLDSLTEKYRIAMETEETRRLIR